MLPDRGVPGYAGTLRGQPVTQRRRHAHRGNSFTRITGGHTIVFGGEHRIYRDTKLDMGNSSGQLNFNTNWTKGPNDNSGASPLGQGLASFLLGLPTGGNFDINGSYAQEYRISGVYIQDSWKATSRLTIIPGLRWEMEVPTVERFDRAVWGFDYAATLPISAQVEANYAAQPIPQIEPRDFKVRGGMTYAGVGGNPRRLWYANRRNLAPRIALAYRVNPRTVIRAGYGIFFDIARQNVNQAGYNRQTTLSASPDSGRTFVTSLENPFPNGFLPPVGNTLGLMTNVGQTINTVNVHLLNPYTQRWQLSVQRRFGRQGLFEAAYVGNRGTRLRLSRSLLDAVPAQYLSTSPVRDDAVNNVLTASVNNPFYPLLPGTGLSGSTVQVQQLLRPFPQFTGGGITTNDGFSWYHALQTRVEKRFSSGYTITGVWTWQKFMEATAYLNTTDLSPTHAISDQDRTHRMVGTAIYELPFGRSKRWGASLDGFLGKLVSGWQVQGIYQRQSGPALGFGDVPFFGNFKDIALPADRRNIERWFNTDAGFERNSKNNFVYHVRTFPLRMSGLRSMGLNMIDLSTSKNMRLTEWATMQFRAEFINALNHTHFGKPQMNPTNSDFGRVTNTLQQPRNIQFALRIMF